MPIYAYRCASCGHAQDVLQKMSDPLLTTCPACGADAYSKQLTAAGFQLKGSGWYVTDFKGGNTAAKKDAAADGAADQQTDKPTDKATDKPADKAPGASSDGAAAPAAAKSEKAEKATPAPAAPPAPSTPSS
jgi:putative FmdB family regulatory protein